MRVLKLVAALSILVAFIGVVAIAGWSQIHAYMARPGPAKEETVVVLPRGAPLAEITTLLSDARVIERPWMFRLAIRVLGRDRELKAGEYAFPAGISPSSVIGMLASGDTVARRLTIAEGLTVVEILDILANTEGLTGGLPEPPPEGSLLPETYYYALGDDRAQLLRRMQEGMRLALDELWTGRRPDLPLESPQDALILASIIDKETSVPEERHEVAAVFINRLRRGMRLQSDPTVIYGLTGGKGPLGRALTRRDWEYDSAYNTYRIYGLPPGPIGNPGRESIAAVLDPADSDFLFFVANGGGGHSFSKTLQEHNRNVARWRRIKNGEEPRPVAPSPPRPGPVD